MSFFTILLLAGCASFYTGFMLSRISRKDPLESIEWAALAVCIIFLLGIWLV